MSILDAVGGVVSGILNQGTVSAPDLSALFKTIDTAGVYQKDLINALPANLQKQYADYKASNAANITALQTGTTNLGNKLKAETAANYDPNAPAVQAAEDAAKTAIYANVPGQQNAIREALASTGGFDRGTASKQLAAPVLQAGQQYSQQVANITANQLQAKQQAYQQAINTVNTMDDQTLQTTFGMNKEQAMNILNSNRQDLKDQLSSLINQSVTQTNQTLGVQSADITNKYNEAVTNKAQQDAMNNAWVNLGTSAIGSFTPQVAGISQGLGVNTANGYTNVAPAGYASYNG